MIVWALFGGWGTGGSRTAPTRGKCEDDAVMATRFFTPLRCARNDMWEGRDGWILAAAGMMEGRAPTRDAPTREGVGGNDGGTGRRTRWWGWGAGGSRTAPTGGGEGGIPTRFFTPLRCVQNDMWGTLRCARNDMWVQEGGWVPAYARTREGRRGLDSRGRGNNGDAVAVSAMVRG